MRVSRKIAQSGQIAKANERPLKREGHHYSWSHLSFKTKSLTMDNLVVSDM